MVVGQTVVVFAGIAGGIAVLGGAFDVLAHRDAAATAAVAILLGVIALANSPATVLAIIQEFRAGGPVSETVLAVTVVKDVVVISLFTVALTLVETLTGAGGAAEAGGAGLLGLIGALAWEVLGSLAAGIVLGWLVARYLRHVGHEAPLVVLGVAFASVTVLPSMHLSGVLACMVAGFFIENYSPHGDDLMRAVARHALPVYIVFFTIAGASLDLEALRAVWPLALVLAGGRLLLMAAGTALGAALTRAPGAVVRHGWSGFAAQAGVTLGFALLVEQRLPEIGSVVSTVVLAVVAINQLLGPPLFRLGLHLAREIPAADE